MFETFLFTVLSFFQLKPFDLTMNILNMLLHTKRF